MPKILAVIKAWIVGHRIASILIGVGAAVVIATSVAVPVAVSSSKRKQAEQSQVQKVYEFSKFDWTETPGAYTAKADYLCSLDSSHEYHDATVTKTSHLDPKCGVAGNNVWKASYEGHEDTKTEVLPALEHSFGEWAEADDHVHDKRICDLCGETEERSHIHTFKAEWESDDTNHWHAATCSHTSEKSSQEAHSFGAWEIAQDDVHDERFCSVCGYKETKTHVHSYSEEWSKDETNHWHAATCGHDSLKSDEEAHTFGAWAIASDDIHDERICSVCGYKEVKDHVHSFNTSVWESDETSHWHESTCGHTSLKGDEVTHDFDAWSETGLGTDVRTCSVCGETVYRSHEHWYSESWSNNSTHHWHAAECSHSEQNIDYAEHYWSNWEQLNETTDKRVCTVCGYEEQRSHEHFFSSEYTFDDDYHWYAATCTHTEEISGKAAHTMGDWHLSANGFDDERECSVCDYVEGRKHQVKMPSLHCKTLDNNFTILNHTGSELEMELLNFVSSDVEIKEGSVLKATNSGDYTVTVSLKDKEHHVWLDGTTDDLVFNWMIRESLVDDSFEVFIKVNDQKVALTGGDVTLPSLEGTPMDLKLYVVENDGDEPTLLLGQFSLEEDENAYLNAGGQLIVKDESSYDLHVKFANETHGYEGDISVNFEIPEVRTIRAQVGDADFPSNYGDVFNDSSYGLNDEEDYILRFGNALSSMVTGPFKRIVRVRVVFSSYNDLSSIQAYASLDKTTFTPCVGDINNYISSSYFPELGEPLVFDFTSYDFEEDKEYTLKFWSWGDTTPAEVVSIEIDYISSAE